MTSGTLPRMRTIADCYQMLKNDDPGTAISRNAIRSMVLSGKIPHVQVGVKRLVDYDRMLEILHNPSEEIAEPPQYGAIRRVI